MARMIPCWGTPEWVEWYTAEHGFAPLAGGSEDDDADDKGDDKPDDAPPPKPEDREPDDKVEPDDDWKAKSRKNETRAKKAEREARELRERLEKLESESKTEHEKAIEAARKEEREKVQSEAEKERRHDRLESKCVSLGAKGFEIGEGDDAQTVKFADPDDALIYVERAIRSGDIDESDIFDDEGKVNADALKTALGDILESKPHLRAKDNGKPNGSADTRKGSPADKDLESMSPADHDRRKYPANAK
jgi:hypothetical protein